MWSLWANQIRSIPKTLSGMGRGVLTVGEGDRFLRDGGMVALVVDNRRVRFDINQTAATGAGSGSQRETAERRPSGREIE